MCKYPITAIWAQDQKGLIGKDQTMPWHLPADLKHFKAVTTGHAMVMGRVTFDGMGQRPLPNRTTLILTRDKTYQVADERVLVFHDVADVLAWQAQHNQALFVVGGAQIYQAFAPYTSRVIRTEIAATFDGDTYFPEVFDWSEFDVVEATTYEKDAKNAYDFTVSILERKERP